MPYANLSASLTNTQITAINDAMNTIKTNLPFLINLTQDERATVSKMGPDGFSYVTKALDYAGNNLDAIPAALSYAEGAKDLSLSNALRPILQQMNQLTEAVNDTMMAAGVEAKEFADNFYELAKMLSKGNTPGMNAVAEDLGVFYEKAQAEALPTPLPA